jgi:hypothetical protein
MTMGELRGHVQDLASSADIPAQAQRWFRRPQGFRRFSLTTLDASCPANHLSDRPDDDQISRKGTYNPNYTRRCRPCQAARAAACPKLPALQNGKVEEGSGSGKEVEEEGRLKSKEKFFSGGPRFGSMSGRVAANLSGAMCTECRRKGGQARVCFRPPSRYLWGCARFPACKDPRAWQVIEVPQEQRDECDAAFKASQARDGDEETDEGETRPSTKAVSGQHSVTKRVLTDSNAKSEGPP